MTPTQHQLCATLKPYIAQYHEWLGFYRRVVHPQTVLDTAPWIMNRRLEIWDHVEDAWYWVINTAVNTAQAEGETHEWVNEVLRACHVQEGIF